MRLKGLGKVVCAFAILALLSVSSSCVSGCGNGREETGEAGRATEGQGPAGRPIPLQTLLQGTICEYGRYEQAPTAGESAKPSCLAVGDGQGLQRLLFLTGLELPPESVDFGQHVILAALQGTKPTSGYAISIVRAVQTGTEVRVEVEVVEPEPGSVNAQVLTSPYHLVLVRRSDFQPRGKIDFTFVDSFGERLEACSLEI